MRKLRTLVWLIPVLSATMGLFAVPHATVDRLPARSPLSPDSGPDRPRLDSLRAVDEVSGSLFRTNRHEANVAFDPSPEPPAQELDPVAAGQPAALPAWVLSGVILGPQPLAVLEGVDGADGPLLVLIGDSVGVGSVQAITEGGVTFAFPDTVWTIELVSPWR